LNKEHIKLLDEIKTSLYKWLEGDRFMKASSVKVKWVNLVLTNTYILGNKVQSFIAIAESQHCRLWNERNFKTS